MYTRYADNFCQTVIVVDKPSLLQTSVYCNFWVGNFFAFFKGSGFIIKFGVVSLPKFAINHSQKYSTRMA
jgi:hypothetical protein